MNELKKQLNDLDPTNFLLILENLNLSFFAQNKKQLDEITKINKSKLALVQNFNCPGIVLDEFLYCFIPKITT